MKNKDIIILQKILKYCNEIEDTCKHFTPSLDEFSNNFIFRNACSMCILQIGELCKLISDELRNEVRDIPWKSWCGIRDIFAHQYSNMDYEIAWDTIVSDIPVLKSKCEELLNC